ncbi:hypothetical protein BDN71DRAFT_1485158 [Pleurotus eryngii]|uniref:Uncharacterized protein n=1 Tax=Pleurotus eryngii TaxID=5323 RepID=A0A9P6D9X3_PLEER|nr:hypothetical protein BDN71DRAFT_1485158 [Pleurotus eryngii]
MCPNSCVAYTGPFAKLTNCPKCGGPCYDTHTGKPRQHFYTIPLAPYLQVLRQETERLLGKPIEEYYDFVCRKEYLEAVLNGTIKNKDFVVMMSLDGAQLYQMKQSDCWIYIWVILDIEPGTRYKKKYVIPGSVIPGPNKPKNTDSFLFPGLAHISAVQKEGL